MLFSCYVNNVYYICYMKNKTTFQHWLEPDEHEAIMINKAKTGVTLEGHIRTAIREYVKKLKK